MKKCIGLICEGPTDRIVLRTIINHISFVPVLQDNWTRVVKQCESAADFDGQIRRLFFGKL